MLIRRLLFLVFALSFYTKAYAASCCGGGASFPSLILSDDKAQLGFSAAFSKIIGDAPLSGKAIFRSPSDDEWIYTYTLDAASLITDRWQLGSTLPFVEKTRSTESDKASAKGMGDISVTTAYEFLPEFSYSKWKPRGFLYFKVMFPTGGSIYESTKLYAVDSRGTGLYTFSVGTFLIKSWGSWDSSFRLAISKPLDRSFSSPSGDRITIRSGYEFNSAIAVGYSPLQGDWRLGLSMNPFLVMTRDLGTLDQLKWTTSFDISKMINRNWVSGISFSDQTLLGPARNSSLERSLSLFIRYKWER